MSLTNIGMIPNAAATSLMDGSAFVRAIPLVLTTITTMSTTGHVYVRAMRIITKRWKTLVSTRSGIRDLPCLQAHLQGRNDLATRYISERADHVL